MDTFSEGILVGGVRGYRSEADPDTFYYVPGAPEPERGASGEATLLLLRHSEGGSLQGGARWAASEEALAELRRQLARTFSLPDAAGIRLLSAPVEVQGVVLERTGSDGRAVEVARASPSGFPPYAVVFAAELDNEAASQAERAVRGERGLFRLRYEAVLSYAVFVSAQVSGTADTEIPSLVSQLRSQSSTLADDLINARCAERVEQMIATGSAQEEITHSKAALLPDGLLKQTTQEARDKATSALVRLVRFALGLPQSVGEAPADPAHFHGIAQRSANATFALRPEADIGTWFTSAQADRHVLTSSAPNPVRLSDTMASGASRDPRTIRLAFTMPSETPVAFVEIVRGTDTVRLMPPRYDPVTLPGTSGTAEGVAGLVRTHYTDGSATYEAPLGAADDLTPDQLGISVVTVDATARKDAGVKRLQMTLRYLPDPTRADAAQEHAVNFRFGDWLDDWAFVTGQTGGKGVVEYTVTETSADDTRVEQDAVRAATSNIKL